MAHLRRIFSGIQPTGIPHLGNYLGAISNWVTLQNDFYAATGSASATPQQRSQLIYCVVDLHAMTLPYDAPAFGDACRTTAACLIGCGLDPAKVVLFKQSEVREHSELAWILSCITPLGWLNRMTQFKQKSASNKKAAELSGLGLYAYPVLQAADILLYRGTEVPVGEDQHQHIELARDIALMFNKRFCGVLEAAQAAGAPGRDAQSSAASAAARAELGAATPHASQHAAPSPSSAVCGTRGSGATAANAAASIGCAAGFTLPLPQTVSLPGEARRVMSLRDGARKMSKSDPSDFSRVNLTDGDDLIRDKIRKAKTDSDAGFSYDPAARPEKSNLLGIFSAVSGTPVPALCERYAAASALTFKDDLASALIEHLRPLRGEAQRLLGDPGYLDAVLTDGARAAREIAAETMAEVRAAAGLTTSGSGAGGAASSLR